MAHLFEWADCLLVAEDHADAALVLVEHGRDPEEIRRHKVVQFADHVVIALDKVENPGAENEAAVKTQMPAKDWARELGHGTVIEPGN